MVYMSPFLSNQLQNKGYQSASSKNSVNEHARHEAIYQNLTRRANEVKPNEAKAVVLQEDPFTRAISCIKDTKKDCVNLKNVIKTGKISDNNLGRINDIGLKTGVMLIATFLASHAKTKTQALMEFIGGSTFVAAMTFWPKIFINLPARLIHGFPIDQKYISAQGDKKDFFLDNQFIVWDAMPKDQMKKYAKKAGIDYDSENGEEKIRRKMQKTALQNRTLNMAAIGFATPLSAALVGNFVEPKVESAVIKHEAKKVQKIFEEKGIKQHLKDVRPEVKNTGAINDLFASYSQKGAFNNEFFKKLAQLLQLDDITESLKDCDDLKPVRKLNSADLAEELKKLYKSKAKVADTDELYEILYSAAAPKAKSFLVNPRELMPFIPDENIASIIKSVKNNPTLENLEKELAKNGIKSKHTESIIAQIKTDNAGFVDTVKSLNQNVISVLRARAKAYLNTINPIIGSKSESIYTKTFNETMKDFFSRFIPKKGGMAKLKSLKEGDLSASYNALQEFFKSLVKDTPIDSDDYISLIESLKPKSVDLNANALISQFVSDRNLANIADISSIQNNSAKEIVKSITGYKNEKTGIFTLLKDFINKKQVDMQSIQSKAIICANVEARLKQGLIQIGGKHRRY